MRSARPAHTKQKAPGSVKQDPGAIFLLSIRRYLLFTIFLKASLKSR